MRSPLSRRVLGSLALAAVTATSVLSAVPAHAAPVHILATSYESPSTTLPPVVVQVPSSSSGELESTVLDLTEFGAGTGDIEVVDPDTGQVAPYFLRVHDIGDYFGSVEGGVLLLQYKAWPEYVGKPEPVTVRVPTESGQWLEFEYYVTVGNPVEISAWGPTFIDGLGSDDSVRIENQPAVTYLVNGQPAAAGVHPVSGSVRVTAAPANGYYLSGTTRWDYDFNTASPSITSTGPAGTMQSATVVADSDDHAIRVEYLDPETHLPKLSPTTAQGTYYVFRPEGRIELGFTPQSTHVGPVPPIVVQVTRDGVTKEYSYAPTVIPSATPATPAAPTFTDAFGSQQDGYTIPKTTGVRYLADGKEVADGSHPATGTVVITAVAESGYELSGTARWEHTFSTAGAVAKTSTGPVETLQSVEVDPPAGASLWILDRGLDSLTLSSMEGNYEVAPDHRSIAFHPSPWFAGQATSITYAIVTAQGERSEATYTPTVTAPDVVAEPLASEGEHGTGKQTVTVPVPEGGGLLGRPVLDLLDANGEPTPSVSLAGIGQFTVVPAPLFSGGDPRIEFTPEPHFSGEATVDYRISHYGKTGESTYTATVKAPTRVTPAPVGHADAFGVLDDTYTIPDTAGVDYYIGDTKVTPGNHKGAGTVTVEARPQVGYALDGTTTFTLTFTDTRAQDLTSTGVGRAEQSATVAVPAGGSVRLLDLLGFEKTTASTHEGTYTLDVMTGRITFAPSPSFAGTAQGATFRITERDGTPSTATYKPEVTKPAAPTAAAVTSTGAVRAPQSVEVAGGTVTLLDAEGAPGSSVSIPGEGTYRLVGKGSGQLTFTPETCFAGEATPVTYRVTDAYEQSGEATYTATVEAPPAPGAPALTSGGTGTEVQHTSTEVPTCGYVSLLDDQDAEKRTLAMDGVGTFAVDRKSGKATFTPAPGFHGEAGVRVLVDDGYGNRVEGRYDVVVNLPAAPRVQSLSTHGTGTAAQQTAFTLPARGTIELLDSEGRRVKHAAVTHPGKGTFTLDRTARTLRFTAELGFAGAVTQRFVVRDGYDQQTEGSYTAVVAKPAAPALPPVIGTTGGTNARQTLTVAVPTGGSVALLDAKGRSVTSLSITGQGTYQVTRHGIRFTPLATFYGKAHVVRYVVVDAYGQTSRASYAAAVNATPEATVIAPARQVHATQVAAACSVSVVEAKSCTVTAYTSVKGKKVKVGAGKVTRKGGTDVTVTLTKAGRGYAARPQGLKLVLEAAVTGTDNKVHRATTRTHVVRRSSSSARSPSAPTPPGSPPATAPT